MKTRLLIAVVVALSAFATVGSAFAERPYPPDESAMSTKSRAEVRADLEQARKDGLLMNSGERDDLSGAHGVAGSRYSGGLTREEVRAEAIKHMKDFKPGSDDMYGR